MTFLRTASAARYDVVEGDDAERQLERLLSASFPVPPGASFYDDFPVWCPSNGAAIFRAGAFEAGRLLSSAGARLAWLKGSEGDAPVVVIGAVVTDPEARGRGYASGAVRLCLEWARARGAAAAFLFGQASRLYEREGFELCGRQARVSLGAWSSRAGSDSGAPLGKVFSLGIFRRLERRPGGLAVRPVDVTWIRAHKNVAWRFLGDPSAPAAYAAIGRGIDLQGLVHEWGGAPAALVELFSRIAAEEEGGAHLQVLGGPELFRAAGVLWDESAEEPLCMARILDPLPLGRAFGLDLGGRAPSAQSLFGGPGAAGRVPLWFWGLDGA